MKRLTFEEWLPQLRSVDMNDLAMSQTRNAFHANDEYIEKLERKIKRYWVDVEHIEKLEEVNSQKDELIKELTRQRDLYKKSNDFYANKKTWDKKNSSYSVHTSFNRVCAADEEQMEAAWFGGKLARTTQKEVDQLLTTNKSSSKVAGKEMENGK